MEKNLKLVPDSCMKVFPERGRKKNKAGLPAALNFGMAVLMYVFLHSLLLKHHYMRSCGIPLIDTFRNIEVICNLLQNTALSKDVQYINS